MYFRRMLLSACAALALSLTSAGDPPKPPAPDASDGLPAGRWSVEFANGVVETCEIKRDRTASVVEPRRASAGKVTAKDGSFVIACEDDRLERWMPVGKRMVVEHWYPGSQVPVVTPVLGIAERAE
jgi:hypothetical protein